MAECPPTEPYEICILETQRNNALNDLARLAGTQDRQEKYWRSYVAGRDVLDDATAEYWRQYVDGTQKHIARAAEAGKGRAR